MKWFRKAADLGDAFAMNRIGRLYKYGQGACKDEAEAKRWFQKARAAGYKGRANAGSRRTGVYRFTTSHTLLCPAPRDRTARAFDESPLGKFLRDGGGPLDSENRSKIKKRLRLNKSPEDAMPTQSVE